MESAWARRRGMMLRQKGILQVARHWRQARRLRRGKEREQRDGGRANN